VNVSPLASPTVTAYGPTCAPVELAARKLLALFSRAEARDFVDVHVLTRHFDLDELVTMATDLDAGFTTNVLADMLGSHERFADDEIGSLGGEPQVVRRWADGLRDHLRSQADDRREES
jgi:hypothetical protein